MMGGEKQEKRCREVVEMRGNDEKTGSEKKKVANKKR